MKTTPSAATTFPLHHPLLDLVRAVREDDHAGKQAALIRVNNSAWCLDQISRRLGVKDADRDDVRNLTIFRMYKRLPAELSSPKGWANRVADSVARDWLRGQKRFRGQVAVDAEHLEVFAAPQQDEEPDLTRPGPAALARAAEEYAVRADHLKRPRGHQIRAWYSIRVLRRSSRDFAAEHAAATGATVSDDTAWQWVGRGAQLILTLAATDDDPVRADLMRRAAGQRGPSPRGPSGRGGGGAAPANPPTVPRTAKAAPAFGEYERRAVLFYAFTSGLHRRTGVERVVALRWFARVLAGAPVNAAALHGAELAGAIALDDPDEERGDRMAELVRHVLALRP